MKARAPLVSLREPSLFGDCPVSAAVAARAGASDEERGAIFTRREVVDFILDLAGYRTDRPLHRMRLLEPSFGEGDFLIPALDRLLTCWNAAGRPHPIPALSDAIRAVELHGATFRKTRGRIVSRLVAAGISAADADALSERWLVHDDFLLTPLPGHFDAVVGNPPYVRQEMIADALMAEYRARYSTIYDRADLYVPFIERSLRLLTRNGRLGFICSDRWMKNRYGGPLRRLVADDFHLKIVVDMVDTPAFHADVVAYPAITVIERCEGDTTRVAHRPPVETGALSALARSLLAPTPPKAGTGVEERRGVTAGAEPWMLGSSDGIALVRRLERAFPSLEEAGCNVGIGVATGADRAFIGPFDQLDVERSRKLPLAMTRDIDRGSVAWRGLGVVNPFGPDGRLVNLADFPKLRRYLEARRREIAGRHVAKKSPANWYRTIDRIYPEIAAQPKLLIPDIKGEAHIVFENEGLYPHHNLYFVTSDCWDLHALQAVLLSGVARLFVASYSTKMRGGYLRFQAQYLRRIRVPHWSSVPARLKTALIAAGQRGDATAASRAVVQLYGLTPDEMAALNGTT